MNRKLFSRCRTNTSCCSSNMGREEKCQSNQRKGAYFTECANKYRIMFSYHVQLLQFVIKFSKHSRDAVYICVKIEEMLGKLCSFNLECGITKEICALSSFKLALMFDLFLLFCYFAGILDSHSS